jgi:plasmid stability protein
MVSITIRNVPEETRNELAARAARSGRSLQEYLRAQLVELAERPDIQTWLAQVREHKRQAGGGIELSTETILSDIAADRR